MEPPVHHVGLPRALRIIPSRYPPVGIFDTVANAEDLEATFHVEGMTNERLRAEVGDLRLVPQAEWLTGPGTTPIMSAFTHMNPSGSRFSDGTYGVYYAAGDEETAIAEARHGRERFMRLSGEPAQRLEMRMYAGAIEGNFHDLRGLTADFPGILVPDSYTASQAFARTLRAGGSAGIVYESVRRTGGECVACFKTAVIRPVVQAKHFYFLWDGNVITDIMQVARAA